MNTNNHAQGSTDVTPPMDNWVLESSFLDLLADEEKPDDLDDWALQRGWSSIVARARDRVEKVSRNGGPVLNGDPCLSSMTLRKRRSGFSI